MTTTNYFNTFIEIAEDCTEAKGILPPTKGDKKTVANRQFEMVFDHPYKYTSDEVIFTVHALRKEYEKHEWEDERKLFFSKGQPCFRASPLSKRYGWGVHSDGEGKIALFGCETNEYKSFLSDNTIVKTKAMRSKRK